MSSGGGGWRGGRGRGPPPRQQGVWGSAVSPPIGAWGGAPEAFTFLTSNPAKRIYIRAKDNEVYCDNAPRNGRQQTGRTSLYCRWDVCKSLEKHGDLAIEAAAAVKMFRHLHLLRNGEPNLVTIGRPCTFFKD